MTYLVVGEVTKEEYDTTFPRITEPKIRMVQAKDSMEAEEKFVDHFHAMDLQYSHHYHVVVDEVSEMIR